MARGPGKDAVSESLNTKSSVAETVAAADGANPNQTLLRAVVVEVLYDLAAFPDEDIEEFKTLVDAPDMIATAPRNSILARVVTGGADKKATEAKEKPTEEEQEQAQQNQETIAEKEKVGEVGVLAYPFFPPHLCMPLKPGEQVWLITDSSDVPSKIMYWMCRITEPDHVDDVNYTHGDRKLAGSTAEKTSKEKVDRANGKSEDPEPPLTDTDSGAAADDSVPFDLNKDLLDDRFFGFPNGTGEPDAFTLKDEMAYEDIVNISGAYAQFRAQAVPRYTKRPGDLVIQGSNNTLICLGEDRGWKFDDDPSKSEFSNATEDEATIGDRKDKMWGAIDLVAGRGRYDWLFLKESVKSDVSQDPFPTSARVIKTSPNPDTGREQYVEVNKNPLASDNAEVNRKDNPTEGDPDYFSDASRLVIAHSSDVDTNFNIAAPGETIPSAIGEAFGQLEVINSEDYNPAGIVLKTDEVRIVARKLGGGEPVDRAPEINGSIRLIKEGAPDEDLAALMLLPDGTIQISGSKIVIGRATADGGNGTGPGEGGSQPYVRYSDLQSVWHNTMDALTTFCDTVLTHTTPGYGAPSVQLNQAVTELKSSIEGSLKGSISSVQSERIFGE